MTKNQCCPWDTKLQPAIRQISYSGKHWFVYYTMPYIALLFEKSNYLKTTQFSNCELGNPLLHHKKYTYQTCKFERRMRNAMEQCKCKPYQLGDKLYEVGTPDSYEDCSLYDQMHCVDKLSHVRGKNRCCFILQNGDGYYCRTSIIFQF